MQSQIDIASLLSNRPFRKPLKNAYPVLRMLLLAALSLSTCLSPTRPSSSGPLWAQDAAHPGMHLIYAAGKSFMQGADDAYASAADFGIAANEDDFYL